MVNTAGVLIKKLIALAEFTLSLHLSLSLIDNIDNNQYNKKVFSKVVFFISNTGEKKNLLFFLNIVLINVESFAHFGGLSRISPGFFDLPVDYLAV